MKYFTIIFLMVIALAGCSKDDDTDWMAIDDGIIKEHLEENNLEAAKHPSGIYYNITKEGSGSSPSSNSVVSVRYEGRLLNGHMFDNGQGRVQTFPLNGLIKGWQICIPWLKRGGKGTFYIPSELAYGKKSPGSIPAHSVLVFNIELVDFE